MARTESTRRPTRLETPVADEVTARLAILEASVEASDDAIIGFDRELQVTSWNPSAERILGYGYDEIMQGQARAIFPAHLHASLEAVLSRAISGDRIRHFETEVRRNDGMLVPVSLSISPVLDESGHVVGAVLLARDITERRDAQLALAEIDRSRRTRQAVTRTGTWLWDLSTDAVQWTVELFWINDVNPLEFEGTFEAHLRTVHSEDVTMVRALIEGAVESGRSAELEHRIMTPTGDVRWVALHVDPTKASDGSVIGLQGVSQDITEHRIHS